MARNQHYVCTKAPCPLSVDPIFDFTLGDFILRSIPSNLYQSSLYPPVVTILNFFLSQNSEVRLLFPFTPLPTHFLNIYQHCKSWPPAVLVAAREQFKAHI